MVDRRRDGEGLEAVEEFVAVPLAPGAEYGADGRQCEVADLFAFEIEEFDLRAGIQLVLGEELSSEDARALQNGVGLRNDFFPILAVKVGCVGDEDAITRRVFVGSDEQFSVKHLAAVKKILARGHARGRLVKFQVDEKKFCLGLPLLNLNQ